MSSGVLSAAGKDYLIIVGEHASGDPKNGVTMIYDIAEDVRPLSPQLAVCWFISPGFQGFLDHFFSSVRVISNHRKSQGSLCAVPLWALVAYMGVAATTCNCMQLPL